MFSSRRLRALVLTAVLAASIYAMLIHLGYGADEVKVLFASWEKGEPLILVKLRIHLPKISADKCFIAVHRFPSLFNPTKTGLTERVYASLADPGSTVNVAKLLSGIPVKTRFDSKTGRHYVEYYEPQEFIVVVHCVENNATVFKWSSIVEIYPSKIVNTYDVNIPSTPSSKTIKTPRYPPSRIGDTGFTCSIVMNYSGEDEGNGYCHTWVKGPLLHGAGGLSTSFGVCTGGVPGCGAASSAVYLESYSDSAWCPLGLCDHYEPEWSSAGKKLVPSIVKTETRSLTGVYGCESSVRVYFRVRYVYEYWTYWDSFSGNAYRYWLLYPHTLRGLARADDLGVGYVQYTCPELQPPSYADIGYTDTTISFGEYGARETNIAIARVYVTFSLSRVWSVTLGVDFYKAGRNDNQYKTPYVAVEDIDGEHYYWWFKNNDPMSYEVFFSRS